MHSLKSPISLPLFLSPVYIHPSYPILSHPLSSHIFLSPFCSFFIFFLYIKLHLPRLIPQVHLLLGLAGRVQVAVHHERRRVRRDAVAVLVGELEVEHADPVRRDEGHLELGELHTHCENPLPSAYVHLRREKGRRLGGKGRGK